MTLAIIDARAPKYVVISAGAELTGALVAQAQAAADQAVAAASVFSIINGGTLNLYDKTANVAATEINGGAGGTLTAQANSETSGLMPVYGMTNVAVSGLPANTAFALRFYRFVGADGTTIVSFGDIPASMLSTTFAVPVGAWYFQMTVRQRDPATPAGYLDAIQIEDGATVTPYQAYKERVHFVNQTPVFVPRYTYIGDRNLFDGGTITGFEINGGIGGALAAQADSVLTNLIDVDGASFVTVSGLPANPDFPLRFYRFLTDAETIISYADIGTALEATIPVPGNAAYFQMNLQQRQAGSSDFSAVQIEVGATATSYQSYTPLITAIDGKRIKQGGSSSTDAAAWIGRDYLLLGDSITETGDVDAGDYTITSLFRDNWPNYAFPLLEPLSVATYARSGAHFASLATGLTTFQKLENQISQAITDARTPSVIVVAIGTNDINTGAIGTYATAMGKVIGALDLTLSIEAARSAFYRIQNQWPDAKKFYVTPLQRADITPDTMEANVDLFARMASRYGFQVIDGFRESNIVADFEVNGAAGDDLYDGLHPAISGRQKLGELIASRIRARLVG